MKIPKELRAEAEQAVSLGWRIEPTRNGHVKWFPPSGDFILTGGGHGTSDPRAIKNARARLRRAGLDPTAEGKGNGRKQR